MHDKERQLLNNNKNKRTSEVASAVSTPNSGSNTSPSPNPNKKRKSEAASANIVGLKVSASTENSTGRYKKEHFCMTIAKTILSEQDVETARNTLLSQISEAQREDPNVVKYATIQAQESTYDLLFGDKNDMRRLIGIEGNVKVEKHKTER
jgi:hypothetical protein